MKHKGLLTTVLAIAVMTIVAIFNNGKDAAVSQQDRKGPVRVGILQYVSHEALDAINEGIIDGLAEAGYSSDTIVLTQMNAEADQSKIKTMSDQLVANNDILVGIATPAAQGLASATTERPVVMGAISDPVGSKLVTNLGAPEGNVTGTSNRVPIKQSVELIRIVTPDVKKVGVLYASSEDNSVSQVADFKTYAKEAGLEVIDYAVPSTNEITTTVSTAITQVDAIFVPQDNTIASAFSAVISVTDEAKIPVYSSVDSMVEQGSLAAISQNQYQLGRETAKVIVQLLAGKEVRDVPVSVIDTGTPVINKTVAKAYGITISDKVAKTADLIETKKE